MEDNKFAYKELYQKEKNENEKHKGELEKLKSEINIEKEKNKSLAESFENLSKEKEIADDKLKQASKEKEIADEKLKQASKEKEIADETLKQAMEEASSLRIQLEEMKVTKEKELDNIRAKLNDEKNNSIAKEKECQHLIKENEKLQSKYEATKKHNHILLDENSRVHSAMQELQDAHKKIRQLKEYIQKTKLQISQLLKQNTEETIMFSVKANQDCSAIMIECSELTRKLNAVLCENRYLRGN